MTVITRTGAERTGKFARTAAYYAAFIALGLGSASLGPTLQGLAQHTGTRLSEISFLFAARALGYLIGSLVGGRLYDRVPGHRVMGSVLIVMAAMLALTPVVPLLWLLTAVLFALGMGEGAVDVGGNTLLVWVHRSGVGPFMNGLHFFWGVGAFLSPVIIAQLVLISSDITLAYWVLALLMLPVAVALFRLASPPAEAVAQSGAARPASLLLVVLVALFLFLYVGAEASMGGWIFTYATAMGLSSETAAAYMTSAFWGALTAGRLLAIPLAARLRPHSILLMDLVGCLVSVGLILLWPYSMVAMWAGTLGVGLAMASVFPTTLSLAESRMTITGQITGWFFVGASLGGMTVPWFIGQLFESRGPTITMLTILVDLAVMVGVFVALMLSARRVGMKEN
jgi:FHS family Na+ dependent glucose MFS transporter 1